MEKTRKGTFLLIVALILAVLVPAGVAHAYLSSSDYYAQWEQYGRHYTRVYTDSVMTPNPAQPDPAGSTSGPVTKTTTAFFSSRSDYYSRLLNNRFYFPPPSSGTKPTVPGNDSGTPSAPPSQNDAGDVGSLTPDERILFDLANQERVKAGLHTFKVDARLVRLARMKSQDMYQNNYFGHISPTYGSPYDMERDAGISARVMGAENIARCATVQRAHELFMGSEGHRANILDPRHDSIGIGVVSTPYGVYVTQLFIGD
ncbi:MAG: CAP domain-containing protein [Bacillota bacterium]